MAHSAIVMSGKLLCHAFRLTKNPEYLDKSIELYWGILKIPHAQHFHFSAIEGLLLSLIVKASTGLDSTTCTKSLTGGEYLKGVEVSSVARDDSERFM